MATRNPFEATLKPRVDLRLAHGSITEVDSQAIVVGLYQGMQELQGAALAIDQRIDGAITDIVQRRMFMGRVGEVFILPTVRHDIRADLVICAGMGRADEFDEDVLATVAENVARTLVRAKVGDFAITLFASSRSEHPADALRKLVDGFMAGVAGSKARNPLRSITICENNVKRYQAIEQMLAGLYRTKKRSSKVDVSLEKFELPDPPLKEGAAQSSSVTLLATQEPVDKSGKTKLSYCLLAKGAKGAVRKETITLSESRVQKLVAEVDGKFADLESLTALKRYGKKLGETVLPRRFATELKKIVGKQRIIMMHDAGMSRMPWETLCIDNWYPAATGGMSRQFIADHMPVARWQETRRFGDEIDVLLIVNPTLDLPGARKEGKMVEKVAKGLKGVKLKVLYGNEATHAKINKELQSAKYDVLHYAGHTQFYPDEPTWTGIVCAHHKILTGNELAKMKNLPALVFFDSCESARVGGLSQKGAVGTQANIGLAESFLRAGVANYVGTHWVVSDAAAPAFVEAFYSDLLDGKPIGQAVSSGRQAIRKIKSRDWADYIHYGSPDFVLKFPHGETSR